MAKGGESQRLNLADTLIFTGQAAEGLTIAQRTPEVGLSPRGRAVKFMLVTCGRAATGDTVGARKALVPIENKRHFFEVSAC